MIRKRNTLGLLAIVAVTHAFTGAGRGQDAPGSNGAVVSPRDDIGDRLSALVGENRATAKLVGLAAMVMIDGQVVASAADGERMKGSGVKLEIGDQFHIGSITKSVTATMIARLVEKNVIAWMTTVGESLGGSIEMHDDWRGVTLDQLLTHTAAAPPNFPITVQFLHPPEGDRRMKARKAAVAGVLARELQHEPGESFGYSNAGYTIAAVMVEEKTGKSWEDLIRQEIFGPLAMNSAGFGPPRSDGTGSEPPRGHRKVGPLKRVAGVDDDNSPIMGPAGTIHLTLAELCAWGNEHLAGERGEGILLAAETYKQLHTARLKEYAFGWVAPDRMEWTDGRVVWHNGSNTMWYALLVLLPDRSTVVAITSNDGDIRRAERAAFSIVQELVKAL